jgi:hypothetical protein
MPVELQVIRASEFVCLDADELLDFEATTKALQGLAKACWKRGLNRAMLDLRDIPAPDKPHFTATELAALVGIFRDAGFTRHQRLAVLYQYDVHGGVRNFAFFGKMRGLQVQAFREFEAALQWLSEGLEDADELQTGVSVPIAKGETKIEPREPTARTRAPGQPKPARKSSKRKQNHRP